ncbi:MAG: hypothetical protein ABSA26_15965 [Thermoguttaceae bacterium]|jgi:hypothetical protein
MDRIDKDEKILAQLRDDYDHETGKPFKHFFCPILWTDEDTELCMGHVVNEAFSDTCIVQRKDVDNFYGAVAEADFQAFLKCKGMSFGEVLSDLNLYKKVGGQLTIDGDKVDYYQNRGHVSPDHTSIQIKGTNGNAMTNVVAKLSKNDAMKTLNQNWALKSDSNFRHFALASLIKAAHLSMFYALGYRYALSAAGEYVGHQILGTFYIQNQGKPMKEAKQAAEIYFREFINMVAPVCRADNLKGTIEDNKIHVFHGPSGKPFGMGVLVRMNKDLYLVVIPMVPGDGDSMATYLDFLRNDNEFVLVGTCELNRDTGCCEYNCKELIRQKWPKDHSGDEKGLS